jgi:hypothetical protein
MIDIRELLTGLTRVIGGADFPDISHLAFVLDLDISQARIAKTKQGSLGINGARLSPGAVEICIACGIAPWREIWLLFDNPSTPYEDVKDAIFGAHQRIKPSKRSAGFGFLFEIDGWTCGFRHPRRTGMWTASFAKNRNG